MHVFISYCRADIAFLSQVIDALRNSRIENIWYDQEGITAGEDWRDEIDAALNEAFMTVVILTRNSSMRPYVVYEWAYSLGRGIPVLVLLFDSELPHEQIMQPLSRIQHVNCTTQGWQQKLSNRVYESLDVSAEIEFLLISLFNFLDPLRVIAKILLAVEEAAPVTEQFQIQDIRALSSVVGKIASTTRTNSLEFMVTKGHGFTKHQRSLARKLLNEMNILSGELTYLSMMSLLSHQVNPRVAGKTRESLEKIDLIVEEFRRWSLGKGFPVGAYETIVRYLGKQERGPWEFEFGPLIDFMFQSMLSQDEMEVIKRSLTKLSNGISRGDP